MVAQGNEQKFPLLSGEALRLPAETAEPANAPAKLCSGPGCALKWIDPEV